MPGVGCVVACKVGRARTHARGRKGERERERERQTATTETGRQADRQRRVKLGS